MQADAEGFDYPVINQDFCVDCGLCESVCPVIQRDASPILGNSPAVYAMYHGDESVRRKSSSGGAFSALTDYVFGCGGVVFGAAYDADFKVVHGMASTPEEALKFRTSKYSQSLMTGIFAKVREELETGKMVLFSGTPCQVEGLKCYLRKPYDNLITCDIICTSVPSPKLFGRYLRFLEHRYDSKVAAINMKDKTIGWHKNQNGIRVTFANGKSVFRNADTNLWNTAFNGALASRPSCYKCRFANMNRPGDFTIGDYWGIENVHPEWDSDHGVSLVLVNTAKGSEVFEQIKVAFPHLRSTTENCMQSRLQRPITEPGQRDAFWTDCDAMDFTSLAKKYFDYHEESMLRRILRKMLRK